MSETEFQIVNEPVPDSLPTRNSLLNRIKDLGDDASWRDFFETYRELIYNFARKTELTDAEAQVWATGCPLRWSASYSSRLAPA